MWTALVWGGVFGCIGSQTPGGSETQEDSDPDSHGEVSEECTAYLFCIGQRLPQDYATAEAEFGPDGSCFRAGDAEACSEQCTELHQEQSLWSAGQFPACEIELPEDVLKPGGWYWVLSIDGGWPNYLEYYGDTIEMAAALSYEGFGEYELVATTDTWMGGDSWCGADFGCTPVGNSIECFCDTDVRDYLDELLITVTPQGDELSGEFAFVRDEDEAVWGTVAGGWDDYL